MWVINMTHLTVAMNLEFHNRNFQILGWISRSNFQNFDFNKLEIKFPIE